MARTSEDRSGPGRRRSLRVPLLVLAFTVLAAWALLQGQAKVLESMAPPGCTAGGPAALQGGPGSASDGAVVEIVTGWHAFTRVSHGGVIERMATECISTRAPDGIDRILEIRNADTTARVWLISDMALFTPAYGLLLLLILAWGRRLPDPEAVLSQRASPLPTWRRRPELPLLRGAIWLANRSTTMTVLVVTAMVADWTENGLLLGRLTRWWSTLDRTGTLTTRDLDLGLVHRISDIKWLAVLLPLVVAVLLIARQVVHAVILVGRALPRLWVQILLVAVFVVLVVVPDQGADAIRRLSFGQWATTLAFGLLFVVVIVGTAGEILKPLAPIAVPARPSTDRSRTPATVDRARVSAVANEPISRTGAVAAVVLVFLAFVTGVIWFFVAAGVLILVGAYRLRRSVLRAAVSARWAATVLALAAAIYVLARLTGFHGLVVPAVIVGVIGVVSVVLDVVDDFATPETRDRRSRLRSTDIDPEDQSRSRARAQAAAVGRVAPSLAGAIIGAFGFATIRATSGDFALIGAGPHSRLLLRLLIGLVLTVCTGLIVLVARMLFVWAQTWSDRRRLWVLVGLVLVHVPAIAVHDPDLNLAMAADVGTFSLVALFLSGFSLIGSVAARVSNVLMARPRTAQIALPSALRLLRVKSTPIMGLLAVWAVLATTIDNHPYHAVRQNAGTTTSPLTVDSLAATWLGKHATANDVGDGVTTPAVLVAASGGGIRAAYWTAAVLDCVTERDGPPDDPCSGSPAPPATIAARRAALLALSGISGGSLGLSEYVVAVGRQWNRGAETTALDARWFRRHLGADFLAPTVAGWLFTDGLNALLRPDHGVDRAAVLERAWQRPWADDALGSGFFAGQSSGDQPTLLLNGFSVEDGCRVLTSALRTQPQRQASDCTKVVTSGPAPLVLSTVDLRSQLCSGQDISYATAALASARFPFISPAGHLAGCTGGTPVEIVDGGYRETSGASTIDELWPELDAALTAAATTAADTSGGGADPGLAPTCVAPIFVQIDNGYASDQLSGVGRGTVGQFLAPLKAVMNSSSGEEAAAREASRQLMDNAPGGNWFRITTYAHPGSAAPLGWVLSGDAMNDLENQLRLNGTAITAIRALIDHPTPCP